MFQKRLHDIRLCSPCNLKKSSSYCSCLRGCHWSFFFSKFFRNLLILKLQLDSPLLPVFVAYSWVIFLPGCFSGHMNYKRLSITFVLRCDPPLLSYSARTKLLYLFLKNIGIAFSDLLVSICLWMNEHTRGVQGRRCGFLTVVGFSF